MARLLITGFDPFGGEKINPAWEAVKQLPDRVGNMNYVNSKFLPFSEKPPERCWKRRKNSSRI